MPEINLELTSIKVPYNLPQAPLVDDYNVGDKKHPICHPLTFKHLLIGSNLTTKKNNKTYINLPSIQQCLFPTFSPQCGEKQFRQPLTRPSEFIRFRFDYPTSTWLIDSFVSPALGKKIEWRKKKNPNRTRRKEIWNSPYSMSYVCRTRICGCQILIDSKTLEFFSPPVGQWNEFFLSFDWLERIESKCIL